MVSHRVGKGLGGDTTLPAGLWEEGSVLSCRQWAVRGRCWGPGSAGGRHCGLDQQELGLNSGNGTLVKGWDGNSWEGRLRMLD